MAMSKCRECGKAVSTLVKTCPHCGVPKPTKKTKKVTKKTTKKTKTKPKPKLKNKIVGKNKYVWAHCSRSGCKDQSQMYQIKEEALGLRVCGVCQGFLIKAKYENGVPVMPNKIDLKRTEIQKNLSRIALRQKEVELQTDAYNKAMENKTSIASNRSKSYREQSSQSSSSNKGAYDKFADGNLDLATAFWLFGILGSFVGSLILTLLAESVSKIFYFPFVGLNAFIIIGLWDCAENYKEEKLQKKQSAVWGYLTQVFCVAGGLGLISTVYDIIKTL